MHGRWWLPLLIYAGIVAVHSLQLADSKVCRLIKSVLLYFDVQATIGLIRVRWLAKDLVVVRSNGSRRCIKCNIYRDETTHHCSCCDKCIRGFDHHCEYLGVCVGTLNLVEFCRFLFASAFSAAAYTIAALAAHRIWFGVFNALSLVVELFYMHIIFTDRMCAQRQTAGLLTCRQISAACASNILHLIFV